MSAVALAGCTPHGASALVYRRRRPERTVLYGLRQRHLQTWLAESRERDPDGVPIAPYIEREPAVHLVEHVFPKVPVRQWVMTFSKRLRYFLHRDPALLNRVLRIVLRAIETRLRRACPGAPKAARFGAVSFPQRFGSALNAHTHLHRCIPDGVFIIECIPYTAWPQQTCLCAPISAGCRNPKKNPFGEM